MTDGELQSMRAEAESIPYLYRISLPPAQATVVRMAKNHLRLLDHYQKTVEHAVKMIAHICERHQPRASSIPWDEFISEGHAECSYCRNEREEDLNRKCNFLHDYNLRVIELLRRAKKYVEEDARMVADITRHAPLPPDAQAAHDTTEYPSEILLREIVEFLDD